MWPNEQTQNYFYTKIFVIPLVIRKIFHMWNLKCHVLATLHTWNNISGKGQIYPISACFPQRVTINICVWRKVIYDMYLFHFSVFNYLD